MMRTLSILILGFALGAACMFLCSVMISPSPSTEGDPAGFLIGPAGLVFTALGVAGVLSLLLPALAGRRRSAANRARDASDKAVSPA